MIFPVEPVQVDGVTVTNVDVSVAVSTSAAVRVQPVVEVDGKWVPVGSPWAIVGDAANQIVRDVIRGVADVVAQAVDVSTVPTTVKRDTLPAALVDVRPVMADRVAAEQLLVSRGVLDAAAVKFSTVDVSGEAGVVERG